jgi:hypothetical protein
MTTTTVPATEKQVRFARDLYREIRDLLNEMPADDNDQRGNFATWFADVTVIATQAKASKTAMSEVISSYIELKDEVRKAMPKAAQTTPKPAPKDEYPEVPAGRYALPTPDAENAVSFFQIDRPTEGKWAGHVFIRQLFGAPGDFRTERVRGERGGEVYRAIAADAKAAAIRFGKETSTCGVCHSPLTNDKSREYGIGPVCREKTGW